MTNCFHARLALPFLFDFVPTAPNSRVILHQLKSDSKLVNWLSSLNLEVLRQGVEQHYIPPYGKIPVHSDGQTFDNKIKLNFQYGGHGSKMKWYVPVDSELKIQPTAGLFSYQSYASEDSVKQIWEAEVGFPSLVNAGILHSVENGPDPRWVISVPLWDQITNSRLQWDAATIIFCPWIVKESIDV